MPGKVNPVICEVVTQVAAQVIGNDTAITIGGMSGAFELNVDIPLMARNLLESISTARRRQRACSRDRCVDGINADLEHNEQHAEATLSVATALNPYIGYDKAARSWTPPQRAHAARGRARLASRRRCSTRRSTCARSRAAETAVPDDPPPPVPERDPGTARMTVRWPAPGSHRSSAMGSDTSGRWPRSAGSRACRSSCRPSPSRCARTLA